MNGGVIISEPLVKIQVVTVQNQRQQIQANIWGKRGRTFQSELFSSTLPRPRARQEPDGALYGDDVIKIFFGMEYGGEIYVTSYTHILKQLIKDPFKHLRKNFNSLFSCFGRNSEQHLATPFYFRKSTLKLSMAPSSMSQLMSNPFVLVERNTLNLLFLSVLQHQNYLMYVA